MRTVIREPGIIPTLKRKMNARRWIFFDTETSTKYLTAYKKRLNFLLGYAVYCEFDKDYNLSKMEEYEINTPANFVTVLDTHLQGAGVLYVVAHNLQFDLQVLNLPLLLSQAGYSTDLPVLAFSACMWTIRRDKKTVHFFDTQNLFPGKLERLGKDVGHHKLRVDPATAKHSQLMEYCANDCHILRVAVTRYLHFLHDHQLGYFAQTVPWQSFNAFRTRFMLTDIHIHVDYVVLDYERKAYHGARTECYYIGKAPEQDYFLLDVNSMYAHVMKENLFPVEFVELLVCPSLAQLSRLMEEFYVIADCLVDTDTPAFPVKTATKLVFPVGTFRCHLHDAEIRYAVGRGALVSIRYCMVYRRADIFSGYVDFFADLKTRAMAMGDATGERLAKQFLVSLYGKFGQRNPVVLDQGESNYPGVRSFIAKSKESGLIWDEIHWFGRVYHVVKTFEKPYSCPSIAGAITAYGRMYLWELINEAGMQNCYYVDTDSILVDTRGFERLLALQSESRLGFLKLASQSTALEIFNPKDYALGVHRKRKGIVETSTVQGNSGASQEQFRSMKYRLKSGDLSGVDVYTVAKNRVSSYDKGRISGDNRVVPFRLPQDENEPVFDP